jgi:hypothetical protein
MKNLNRRDFGKCLSAGVIALSIATPATARASVTMPGSTPFADFHFGDPQKNGLICVKGACLKEQAKYNFSKYKMPVDINFFGGIEVGAPTYDYYNNQLMRISFPILEKDTGFTSKLNSVLSALNDQYGITLISQSHIARSANHETWSDRYVTSQGYIINIDRRKRDGSWRKAFIKIYDKNLVEGFCMDVNPNYVPK